MAEFATFITDSDLECKVIRAIQQSGGTLNSRVVSPLQIGSLDPNLILLCNKAVKYSGSKLTIDRDLAEPEILNLISQVSPEIKPRFEKNGGKLIAFIGLSGGVGTSSIALNYAFELAQQNSVNLIDLDNQHQDIARMIGLHRIDQRPANLTKNLIVRQGLEEFVEPTDYYVIDLGSIENKQIIDVADKVYVIAKISFNTVERMKQLPFIASGLVLNFYERSRTTKRIEQEILSHFPRLKIAKIPNDPKSFLIALERKSALIEISSNSPARKSIATLT